MILGKVIKIDLLYFLHRKTLSFYLIQKLGLPIIRSKLLHICLIRYLSFMECNDWFFPLVFCFLVNKIKKLYLRVLNTLSLSFEMRLKNVIIDFERVNSFKNYAPIVFKNMVAFTFCNVCWNKFNLLAQLYCT